MTPSVQHILGVLFYCSRFQVQWVNTGRVVALVSNKMSFRDRSHECFIRESMSSVSNPKHPHRPVSILVRRAIPVPLPARLRETLICFSPPDELEPFKYRGCPVNLCYLLRVPMCHQSVVMPLAIPSSCLLYTVTLSQYALLSHEHNCTSLFDRQGQPPSGTPRRG